ncbi:MAG: winged helix DNA-binding domain-containing protein [Gemmatimonadales bacterium]
MKRLSTRALNRALLARQMLLRRKKISALKAVEHLVGMQSQLPNSPYVGLWSRLVEFDQSDLADLYRARKVVRLAMMRSTIHLVSAADCLALRPVVQPVIERGFMGVFSKFLAVDDHAEIEAAGRMFVEERPATFSELSRQLNGKWPDRHGEAMAHAIRTRVALVQVTPRGIWGETSQASHSSAEHWLGQPLNKESSVATLVVRYLAAFGPATIIDAQSWSGLSRLAPVFEELRPSLSTFHDDRDRELFDIPDAPRPSSSTKAPVRFLPEFDNVLLAYKDRRRIVADAYKSLVYPNNGMIQPTVLVDGFVEGKWKIDANDKKATLSIETFRRLNKTELASIEEEAETLLEFAAGNAKAREIRVLGP